MQSSPQGKRRRGRPRRSKLVILKVHPILSKALEDTEAAQQSAVTASSITNAADLNTEDKISAKYLKLVACLKVRVAFGEYWLDSLELTVLNEWRK